MQQNKNLQLPEIEKVAVAQHNKWVASKKGQGHSTHEVNGENLMVPYEDLSEAAKQACKDRTNMFYEAVSEVYTQENTGQGQEQHAATTSH